MNFPSILPKWPQILLAAIHFSLCLSDSRNTYKLLRFVILEIQCSSGDKSVSVSITIPHNRIDRPHSQTRPELANTKNFSTCLQIYDILLQCIGEVILVLDIPPLMSQMAFRRIVRTFNGATQLIYSFIFRRQIRTSDLVA